MATFQDKIQKHVAQLDKELNRYPMLINLEKQTGAPKVYVIGGLVISYIIFVAFNFGGQFLTNLAGFLIPGYYTLSTLFSAANTTKADDNTQWLSYWLIFAFFGLLESALTVTYWVPFYYALKLVLLIWAGLPQFSGAQVIFRGFLYPLLAKYFVGNTSASANLRAKVDGISGGLGGDLHKSS